MGCCIDKCEDITNVVVWSPGVKSSSDAAVPLSELERLLDSEVNSLIPFRYIHTTTFSNNTHNHGLFLKYLYRSTTYCVKYCAFIQTWKINFTSCIIMTNKLVSVHSRLVSLCI